MDPIVFRLLLTMIMTQVAMCGMLTTRDALYTHIFTNYSGKTLPVLDHTKQAEVHVTAFIVNIINFDEMSGELAVTVSFILSWTEERIFWDPSAFDGIESISVWPEDLWRPKMFLIESSDSVRDIVNTSVQPRVYSNGSVLQTAGNVLKVACSVDVTFFPYDIQTCDLTLVNWDSFSSDLAYFSKSRTVYQTFFKTNSQWDFSSGTLRNCSDTSGPCLFLTFVLTRRSNFYVIYIIVPLIFLALINNLVFFMPPTSGERTSVAVTTFLSFIVYMGIVNDVMPQSSDPMAYIYYFIMVLMIYSCCIMFLCIIALRIYESKTGVPTRLATAIWYLRLRFLCTSKTSVADKVIALKTVEKRIDSMTESKGESKIGDLKMENSESDTAACLTQDNVNNDKLGVTWHTVGKTFDAYCCLVLYLCFTVFTLHTLITLSNHQKQGI